MRTEMGLCLACGLLLAFGAGGRANDREVALAVIERGIQAHGGDEALGRIRAARRVAGGMLTAAGQNLSFADEFLLLLPDRLRLEQVLGSGNRKTRVLTVVNGDKGWQSTGGAVTEMPKERLEEIREEAYVFWVTTLVPLKGDAEFQLAPLPKAKLNDRPASGVQVARKDRPDVRLWFDDETGLLVKIERKARSQGRLADKEYLLSEHKEFDGVKLATRRVEKLNGQKFSDVTVSSYQLPQQVDESQFAKP